MGIIGNKILQFVEKEKRLKKGVDIWMVVWYYNKAVARESKKQEKTAVQGGKLCFFRFLNESSEIKNKKV